jgi:thymidylate synthase ThyX
MKKTQLDNGTKLLIVDDVAPEDLAMLQALYSRSAESAEDHLIKVKQAGSGKFMANYYVGYNHKSIADCGSTTFFVEGVSTLAAKAIEDWPLYSGQETSTRYIDMSKQRIEDPVGTPESRAILDRWMTFYTSNQDRVASFVRAKYPRMDSEKEDLYERAVKARTFDVLRGFLPAGITTQLSWHTNLRQAVDHLNALTRHPTNEVAKIALHLRTMMAEQYPNSTSVDAAGVSAVVGGDAKRAAWEGSVACAYAYNDRRPIGGEMTQSGVAMRSTLDIDELYRYREMLTKRPRGSVLPHFMSDFGQLSFSFFLDFGSFRDIQRHRNGVCRMPLLTTMHGFEPWYINELGAELAREASDLVFEQTLRINVLHSKGEEFDRQYYIPLGFRVPCQVTYALPAATYVLELRSSKTVHPTLRRVVHGMIEEFRRKLPGLPLHVDMDADDWSVRRGAQTIEVKS